MAIFGHESDEYLLDSDDNARAGILIPYKRSNLWASAVPQGWRVG